MDTPLTVPSLLGSFEDEDATLNSTEDDPNCFFDEDFEVATYSKTRKDYNNVMDVMDGEQISVYHDDESSNEGTTSKDHQRSMGQSKSLLPSTSTKSWEGSEIILTSNSFLVDPFLLEKVQADFDTSQAYNLDAPKRLIEEERSNSSPRSVTKLFQEESDHRHHQEQHHHDARRNRSSNSQVTSETVSLSVSTSSAAVDKPVSRNTTKIEHFFNKLPVHKETISEEEKKISVNRKPSSARRWSFSSSVDGSDGQDDMDHNVDLRPKRIARLLLRRRSSRGTKVDHSCLQPNQKFFLHLSEEEDLHDFQDINNFSFEGNYLFTRILRERMRIQLKRDMLQSSDKEMYVEIQKNAREKDSSKTRDRGVFFMI